MLVIYKNETLTGVHLLLAHGEAIRTFVHGILSLALLLGKRCRGCCLYMTALRFSATPTTVLPSSPHQACLRRRFL